MLTGEDQGSLVDDPGGAGKGAQLATWVSEVDHGRAGAQIVDCW